MIYKVLAEYIQENIPGGSFVGIEENSGELFVSFNYDDDVKKSEATKHLLEKFDEVKKVIIVERVDIKKATQMVEDLNKMLADDKPDLLDIGKF
jgi:hypothetical protein